MRVRALFLVGFMACGKSSVGRQLAQRLDWDFVDLDTHIETRERQTIAERRITAVVRGTRFVLTLRAERVALRSSFV